MEISGEIWTVGRVFRALWFQTWDKPLPAFLLLSNVIKYVV